mgnify:CR=1 FL=1
MGAKECVAVESQDSRRATGTAALLVVALAVSFQTGSALAVKVIGAVGVIEAAWLRTAFSALLLFVLLLIVRRRALRLPPRGQRLGLVALSVCLLWMNVSFYAAIKYAPVGVVVAVEFLGPLAVAVAGTRCRVDLLWVVLAGAGVALLAGPFGSTTGKGLALALFSGAAWAAYLLLAKRAVTDVDALSVTMYMTAGSAMLLTPLFLVSGVRFVGHEHAVALGLVVAVVSSALPFFLELVALRQVRAATYGVLLSIEPGVAAVMGYVVLGQALRPLEVVAILAIAAAAGGASWTSGSRRMAVDVPAI